MRTRKLLPWIFIATFFLTSAVYAADFTIEKYEDQTCTIIRYNGNATSLGIPSTIEGNRVTAIGDQAFSDCSSLIYITIPDSVVSIGERAFYWCTSLIAIKIPKNVRTIGSGAFMGCYVLSQVIVDKANHAFSDIDGVLFDQINKILHTYPEGKRASSYAIPEGILSIGKFAFNNSSLKSILIPNSVTSIGEYAFSLGGLLSSISIPDKVISIGDKAFMMCLSLSNVTFPNSIISIGAEAFAGCESLASITLPEGITSIGDKAFRYCSNLTHIAIPDSVQNMGSGVFDGCYLLWSVDASENSHATAYYLEHYASNPYYSPGGLGVYAIKSVLPAQEAPAAPSAATPASATNR